MVDVPRRARVGVPRRRRPAGRTSATTRTRHLAAQVLGYVGSITQDELEAARQGLRPERRARPGGRRVGVRQLPPRRRRRRAPPRRLARPAARAACSRRSLPKPGNTVRLTLDVKLQQAAENALAYGIRLAQANGQWAARGGAIVAMDPRDGSILAMASSPTYKPSVYAGHVTKAALASQGLTPKTAPAKNYPVAQPRDAGDVSAGLGVQAGDRARRDAGAPRLAVRVPAVHGHVPLAERQGAPGLQELGPERQPADGHADRARLLVRHVLLPTRRRVLVAAEGPRPAAAEVGDDRSASAARPAPTSGRRRAGSCRRSAGGSATSRPRSTSSGSRATRSSSRSARATCS